MAFWASGIEFAVSTIFPFMFTMATKQFLHKSLIYLLIFKVMFLFSKNIRICMRTLFITSLSVFILFILTPTVVFADITSGITALNFSVNPCSIFNMTDCVIFGCEWCGGKCVYKCGGPSGAGGIHIPFEYGVRCDYIVLANSFMTCAFSVKSNLPFDSNISVSYWIDDNSNVIRRTMVAKSYNTTTLIEKIFVAAEQTESLDAKNIFPSRTLTVRFIDPTSYVYVDKIWKFNVDTGILSYAPLVAVSGFGIFGTVVFAYKFEDVKERFRRFRRHRR